MEQFCSQNLLRWQQVVSKADSLLIRRIYERTGDVAEEEALDLRPICRDTIFCDWST